MIVPKWESKVYFGVYRYQVYLFIVDEFLSLAGDISIDPICTISYQYLYSFHMVHIPSNIVDVFTNIVPYTEKSIYMRSQVCKH